MRALREWAPGEQLAAARAADARALDVVAEDHRPAQGPTPVVPWGVGRWDDPRWGERPPMDVFDDLWGGGASDARALDVVAEDHRPAQGPTPPWLWVHQKEQWDDPAPAGWYVVHEQTGDWSRRVAVASTEEGALALGRANARAWPYPAHVPRTAAGYPDVAAEDHRPAQGPTPVVPRRAPEVGRIEVPPTSTYERSPALRELVGRILDIVRWL